jgi:uncharacterized protein (TIRG00374 family)
VIRSVPQAVAIAAALIGVALFVVTLYYLDLNETLASVRRLGAALPIVALPGLTWHLLRTWGWAVSFPDGQRPAFTRLFRVRLAADAVGFFTVRGIAGEPLKVVLLYDRVPAKVTTVAIAGLVSLLAVTRLAMPAAWDTVFATFAVVAVILLVVVGLVARRRSADYLAALVETLDRLTGRRLEQHRVIRFVLDVEAVLLDLLRGDRRRLVTLVVLSFVCYAIMTAEVWLVLWASGLPISITQALAIETFARVGSVASAAVPGNIGTLEASNMIVLEALGLPGGGALALARRVRALFWAGLGLALYPRVESPDGSQRR